MTTGRKALFAAATFAGAAALSFIFFKSSASTGDMTGAIELDPDGHSVTIAVRYSDCGMDAPMEFLLVGPESGHEYEALFVSEAAPRDIVEAFEKAGFPAGIPIDAKSGRVWPVGASVRIEPSLADLLADTRGESFPPVVFTGGARSGNDRFPVAETNSPNAVFALYNLPQSILQFDDSLDQSATYGRFKPKIELEDGQRMRLKFTLEDASYSRRASLDFKPGNAVEVLGKLKSQMQEGRTLDTTCSFSPEMTIEEAAAAAAAAAVLDSPSVKMNGAAEGEFYFRAFLPLEKWRDRRERLMQPPEVHWRGITDVAIVEIEEDWSDPASLEPRLIPKETKYGDYAEAAKKLAALAVRTSTIILYAPRGTQLAPLYDFKKATGLEGVNWYIFTE